MRGIATCVRCYWRHAVQRCTGRSTQHTQHGRVRHVQSTKTACHATALSNSQRCGRAAGFDSNDNMGEDTTKKTNSNFHCSHLQNALAKWLGVGISVTLPSSPSAEVKWIANHRLTTSTPVTCALAMAKSLPGFGGGVTGGEVTHSVSQF